MKTRPSAVVLLFSATAFAQPALTVYNQGFAVVRERVRTNFNGNNRQDFAEEDFEIKLRNRKAEPVAVRIVEHLYRWTNWSITQKSDNFTKKDAQTIEFNVPVPADTEKIVTYRVRYEWR